MASDISFSHTSVLLDETINGLEIKPDGVYVDGTTGGGGHSYEIASRLSGGHLYCLDKDEDALAAAKSRLDCFSDKISFIKCDFRDLNDFIDEPIDGFCLDLGVSSYQLDNSERGFSYMQDAPLDMRMDRSSSVTAYDIVNKEKKESLFQIIRDYGEEKFASRIADAICRRRETEPIKTTKELAGIITDAIPKKVSVHGHHPAKRTFQAIRIAVNGELDAIKPAILSAARLMKCGGRIAIISFHSLEDRIVKNTFRTLSEGCSCPPDFPVCVCGKKPHGKVITNKPILPSAKEEENNPRARSAKLRIFERNDVTYSLKD